MNDNVTYVGTVIDVAPFDCFHPILERTIFEVESTGRNNKQKEKNYYQ